MKHVQAAAEDERRLFIAGNRAGLLPPDPLRDTSSVSASDRAAHVHPIRSDHLCLPDALRS
eukprot:3805994-Rhodomonas_salina.1